MEVFLRLDDDDDDERTVKRVAELMSIAATKTEDPAVGRPPESRQGWVLPQGTSGWHSWF